MSNSKYTVLFSEIKMAEKVGICGQGPSDFSDFAQYLVDEGSDSISVTPDSVLKTLDYAKTKV